MSDEAAADGVTLTIGDAWRSQKTQDAGKKSNTNPGAYAQGTSSHTYGLAIDSIERRRPRGDRDQHEVDAEHARDVPVARL